MVKNVHMSGIKFGKTTRKFGTKKSKHQSKKAPHKKLHRILSRIAEHSNNSAEHSHMLAEHISRFIDRLDDYYEGVNADKQSAIDTFNGDMAAGIHEKIGTVLTPSLKSEMISMCDFMSKSEDPAAYLGNPLGYLEDVASFLRFPTKELLAFQNDITEETIELLKANKHTLNLEQVNIPVQGVNQEMKVQAEAPPAEANQKDPFSNLFSALRI